MSGEAELIGRNLQRVRRERGMSQGELSRRSGLAKQTLSVVEAGGGNPTVETLAALASALGVSVRQLLTEWGSPLYVQRRDEARWQDDGGRRTRELGLIYGSGYVRSALVRLEADGNADGVRQPLDPGALHHVYVIDGTLRCGTESDVAELSPGDFARFPADVPHRMNPLTEECFLHVVTTIPQRTQLGLAR